MSEAKHTPGPWRVGKGGPNGCPTVGTEKGLMVAMVSHGNSHPTQANARLIAAAPDLLEALEWALDAWDTHNRTGDPMQGDWESDAIAAIAKAKGET
jgi:hypothetical protein